MRSGIAGVICIGSFGQLTQAMVSAPLRFSDILPAQVGARPDAVAVVFGEQLWTYAELSQRVDACARAMMASGVAVGDRVATLCTPRPEYLVVYLASVRIGAIWMGLNPVQQLDEYRYLLSDSKPKLLRVLPDRNTPGVVRFCSDAPFVSEYS